MDFAEITINDKAMFDRYIKQHNPRSSEFTFTNFFMWRDFYKFRYCEICGLLCIISVKDRETPYAFTPIGSLTEGNMESAVSALKDYFGERGWKLKFKRVTDNELPYFKKMVSSEEAIVYDRDNSDYVYLAENLINLSGKKYDGKRNHIKKFIKQNEYEYVALDSSNVDECFRIMREWCEGRDCDCQRGEYCERHANIELLKNFGALGCKGALIKVNGRFEAFTVGEMLNDDTAVIHIEKANGAIQGLYPLINQQFCENECKDATYINREQDLGIEGIRKAKLSYNPVMLVDKYVINMQ